MKLSLTTAETTNRPETPPGHPNEFTQCKSMPTSPMAIAATGNLATPVSQRSVRLPSPAQSQSPAVNATGAQLRLPSDPNDPNFFRILWGKANPYKEGYPKLVVVVAVQHVIADTNDDRDHAIGLASLSEEERKQALQQLAEIPLHQVLGSKFVEDEVSRFLEDSIDLQVAARIGSWTMAELKRFLLTASEPQIKEICPGLRSEVIAGVTKLMSNQELILVASKVYNNLPGSTLGARGYFSSRIQPNSPTDDPEEVLFSVLEGLSYGCGDAIFGINIVASDFANVQRLEETLKDVVDTFELRKATKWCVLAHIDDQMAVHRDYPAFVDCAFQSIGGNEAINRVFNIDIAKLKQHLARVSAQYFETGQGSAVTNKADCGVDMNTLEARAHGLARAFQKKTGSWTIVNTVAGFIGPEVFRTREQLLRACLEDLLMGKLHSLVFGLDICSTYHMSLELEEMEVIMDAVMEAGPAFYMAVAGQNDPMLSYLTTGYRDHPRLRRKHGKKVTEELKRFFVSIGIMQESGEMTERAGDTEYLYVLYRQRKGDKRSETELRTEARSTLNKLQQRGLDLGYGHDGTLRPPPHVHDRLRQIYNDAKQVIYANLDADFVARYRAHGDLFLDTLATDRETYLLKPYMGEMLTDDALQSLHAYRKQLSSSSSLQSKDLKTLAVQFVISEGLNARAMDYSGQLEPLLERLRGLLVPLGATVAERNLFVRNGRVRAGYAVGHHLFGTTEANDSEQSPCAILHCIGERPGNGQRTYSVYISLVTRAQWKKGVDHYVVKVVCGISTLALVPTLAAERCLDFIQLRWKEVMQQEQK